MLLQATTEEQACVLADELHLLTKQQVGVNLNIGVSDFGLGENVSEVIALADAAMYRQNVPEVTEW